MRDLAVAKFAEHGLLQAVRRDRRFSSAKALARFSPLDKRPIVVGGINSDRRLIDNTDQ